MSAPPASTTTTTASATSSICRSRRQRRTVAQTELAAAAAAALLQGRVTCWMSEAYLLRDSPPRNAQACELAAAPPPPPPQLPSLSGVTRRSGIAGSAALPSVSWKLSKHPRLPSQPVDRLSRDISTTRQRLWQSSSIFVRGSQSYSESPPLPLSLARLPSAPSQRSDR